MKNYNQSDYAINKNTRNIVYRFADGTVEITLEEYLAQNPGKTKKHYGRLKARSNAIYRDEARAENAQTKKNVSLDRLGDVRDTDAAAPDEQYIDRLDTQLAARAIRELLEGGLLTDKQRRRFVMHIIEGLPLREIADREGVFFTSVAESITAAMDKLKKNYNFY